MPEVERITTTTTEPERVVTERAGVMLILSVHVVRDRTAHADE